jgi:hypothetical protein
LQLGARAIHAVPHAGLDFAEAHAVARDLRLPFFVSVHDDLAYTALGRASVAEGEAAMKAAWREAAGRFVISEALGEEYCRRYGACDFEVVTDGLTSLAKPRALPDDSRLRVYFMGLFHMGYERNLRAFLDGIALFKRAHSATSVSMVLRCEHVRPQVLAGAEDVTVLPFADEAQVQRDMEEADLLYMPIPFGEEHESFARYSLSTKMVTYVGSGVPIVYHGPTAAAAFALLEKNRAAFTITTLTPEEIATQLAGITASARREVAANALGLAEREFMLAEQTRRFWGTIVNRLTTA